MKKNIIICLLIVIILGLVGYLVYDKFFSEKKEEDIVEKEPEIIEEKKEEVDLDVNSELVTGLYDKVNVFGELLYGDAYNYLYKFNLKKSTELSDEVIIYMGLYNILNKRNLVLDSQELVLSSSEVSESIKEIFGDIEYVDMNVKFNACGFDFNYDANQQKYTRISGGCGGAGLYPETVDKVISATKYDDRIEIISAVVFGHAQPYEMDNVMNATYEYTSDANYSNVITTVSGATIMSGNYEFNIDNYVDQAAQYKYIFKKVNNNYYFDSIEKIK